jgi:hypothetical protein
MKMFANTTTKAPDSEHRSEGIRRDRHDESKKIIFELLGRWIGTVVLIVLIIATVLSYRAKDNFPSGQKMSAYKVVGSTRSAAVLLVQQKTTFNAIITALILLLGLDFFVSYENTHGDPIKKND